MCNATLISTGFAALAAHTHADMINNANVAITANARASTGAREKER